MEAVTWHRSAAATVLVTLAMLLNVACAPKSPDHAVWTDQARHAVNDVQGEVATVELVLWQQRADKLPQNYQQVVVLGSEEAIGLAAESFSSVQPPPGDDHRYQQVDVSALRRLGHGGADPDRDRPGGHRGVSPAPARPRRRVRRPVQDAHGAQQTVKRLFAVALGILTAIGGFVDIGDLVTNAQVGARFGLSLAWVVVVGVLGICVFAEMSGRVAAIERSRRPSTWSGNGSDRGSGCSTCSGRWRSRC